MAEQKKDKGSRRSRHEWRSLLAEFDGGDIGVAAFCRRQAISAASFYRWRNLLGNRGGGDRAGYDGVDSAVSPAFVDLGTLDSAASLGPRIDLKLDLGFGLTLHLVRS